MSELAKTDDKSMARYRPATDIIEREDGFHIFMDMPGVAREDMVIDLQEEELTVTGRTSLNCCDGEQYQEMQFGDCEYTRTISVTDMVDRERIKANLENGVLELFLPKVEKIQPKRITISQA